MPEIEPTPRSSGAIPRVLMVEEGFDWADLVKKRLEIMRIEFEEAIAVGRALHRLNREPQITGVITDAFGGHWRELHAKAQIIGATTILIAGSSLAAANVQTEGVEAFPRQAIESSPKKNVRKATISQIVTLLR
jgi:hypothetical protein